MVAPRPANRLASASTCRRRISIGSVRAPLAWMSTCSRFLTHLGVLDRVEPDTRAVAVRIADPVRAATRSMAFDERRARELDRLQRSNSLLSGVLTILTLISVLGFTFDTSLVVRGATR